MRAGECRPPLIGRGWAVRRCADCTTAPPSPTPRGSYSIAQGEAADALGSRPSPIGSPQRGDTRRCERTFTHRGSRPVGAYDGVAAPVFTRAAPFAVESRPVGVNVRNSTNP